MLRTILVAAWHGFVIASMCYFILSEHVAANGSAVGIYNQGTVLYGYVICVRAVTVQ